MRSQKYTYYFARVDINLVNFSLPPPRRWRSRPGARGAERYRGESAESRGSARPSREDPRWRPGPSRRPSEPQPRARRGRGGLTSPEHVERHLGDLAPRSLVASSFSRSPRRRRRLCRRRRLHLGIKACHRFLHPVNPVLTGYDALGEPQQHCFAR